jgi:hypothetical protein
MLVFDELLLLLDWDFPNQLDLQEVLALVVYLVASVAFRHPYPLVVLVAPSLALVVLLVLVLA